MILAVKHFIIYNSHRENQNYYLLTLPLTATNWTQKHNNVIDTGRVVTFALREVILHGNKVCLEYLFTLNS